MSDFLRVTSLECSLITVRTWSGLYVKLNQVTVGWLKIVQPVQRSIMVVNHLPTGRRFGYINRSHIR
jgi:hypothetical protein